jgi:hypothetical protein
LVCLFACRDLVRFACSAGSIVAHCSFALICATWVWAEFKVVSDTCNTWRHPDHVASSLSERRRRTECKRAGDKRNKPPGHA